jgi:hypothetical protein
MNHLKTLVLGLVAFVSFGWAKASAQVSLRGLYTDNVSSTLSVLFGVHDNNTVDIFVFDYSQHQIGRAPTTIDSSGNFALASPLIGYGISGTLSASGASASISAALTYSQWSAPMQITVARSVWFGANNGDGISIINGRFEGLAANENAPGKTNVTFIVDANNNLYLIHETAGVLYGGVGTVTPNGSDTGGTFAVAGVRGVAITGSFTADAFVMAGTFTDATTGGTYDFNAFRDAAANRLGNVSTRGFVGTGQNILIGGFVIEGGPKLVLIRVLGPGLAQYGITSPLMAPTVSLYHGTTLIETNTGWQNQASQSQVQQIEATQLVPPDAGDDAILVELEAGAYSAEVSGVGGATGTALVEVYEVLLD